MFGTEVISYIRSLCVHDHMYLVLKLLLAAYYVKFFFGFFKQMYIFNEKIYLKVSDASQDIEKIVLRAEFF